MSELVALAAGVRLRPLPELGACLAYVPGCDVRRPALHRLNAASWLIAGLCDGRGPAAVAAAWRATTGAPDDAALRAGIARLLSLGILQLRASSSLSE